MKRKFFINGFLTKSSIEAVLIGRDKYIRQAALVIFVRVVDYTSPFFIDSTFVHFEVKNFDQ